MMIGNWNFIVKAVDCREQDGKWQWFIELRR